MNPERFRKIDELLDQVLDLPESEREAFLSGKANGDEDLRREVARLLKAHAISDNFLEKSAMRIAAKHFADAQTARPAPPLIGKTIGTNKIERMLGAGGMGEVYLAADAKLERKVALKILPAEFTSDDERVKRFRLEAKTISLLNHPNIVTIFDVGTAAGINYITTEFVEGQNLRELGKSAGIKVKDALDIFIQTCEALSVAHLAGIIHRDIKPDNIMLRPDGYVKILDFGLAKLSLVQSAVFGDLAKTAKGSVIGTPAYMSPEQISGDAVDHRTDLWSVGICLFELLTGVNPFRKENRRMTFQAILDEAPPLPSSLNSEISPELDRILIKALEKNPDSGYQTAADLRADLKRVRRALDSPPSRIYGANKDEKSVGRKHYPVFAAALVMPLIVFGIWYFASQADRQPFAEKATEWAAAQNSQLTDSPWVEGYPSISPDGKNIIFASEVDGDGNIYRQRIGGKTRTNLTPNSKQRDTMPAFSPGGKFIAFRSERDAGGIYVMEETGENVRRISDIGYHPSWSPDGKKIVVSDKAAAVHTVHNIPNSSLWTIDAASGERQKLETSGDAIMPNWSPNGHRIAFWFVAGGNPGEIATVPSIGGEPVVIASDAAADWNPVWSPDGNYLYFASNRGGNMSVWRVPVDEKTGQQSGAPESVPTPSKYCRHIALSRDGKILAYVRYESKSNLQSISFDPNTLKAGGEVNWITRGNIEISNPQMSPDGESFLARNPDNTEENLSIFDKNGENWRSLTNDQFRERSPRWSPDGKRIAFHSDRSGKFQIWMISADGSHPEQITFTEKPGANFAVFAPDGKRLIFTETDGNLRRTSILDLSKSWAAQTPQTLPPYPAADVSFSARDWSKDGKKLLGVFFSPNLSERGIGAFDFETSKYEKITDIGAFPVWLGDSRHFIFTSQNTVYLGDAFTKKIAALYKPPTYELHHAAVSPDNRMIYFRYLQVDADVWLLNASPEK